LSDGTFYITVYGSNAYSCTLQNGNPEFTEIDFTSSTLNTDTNRVSRFRNVLGYELANAVNFTSGTNIFENATFHRVGTFRFTTGGTNYLTNSLIV
jgi:hypothetical protein